MRSVFLPWERILIFLSLLEKRFFVLGLEICAPVSYAQFIMSLKQTPELLRFLSTYFSETSADTDTETVQGFIERADANEVNTLINEFRQAIEGDSLDIGELGAEANRWFGDAEEARDWLRGLLGLLMASDGGDAETKDSNGAPLAEGDSVQVIKDLKVKGGSSDLKRGTLIKKIHLIGDPDNIECRVDGSTLVLKTIYLKKV